MLEFGFIAANLKWRLIPDTMVINLLLMATMALNMLDAS